MHPILGPLAVVAVGGAIVAASSHDARMALLGLLVTLLVAPVVALPVPDAIPLAARLVGAFLAIELARIAVRESGHLTSGSLLGAPTLALASAGAFVGGMGLHERADGAAGPPEALAAGLAIGVLAIGPLTVGRDVFRLGVGATLLIAGAALVRVALAGGPSALEQLVTTAVIVTAGGAMAVLSAAAGGARGGFEVAEPAATGVRRSQPSGARALLTTRGSRRLHVQRGAGDEVRPPSAGDEVRPSPGREQPP